jgi:multidrug efflux pump subunit AcrB
VISRNSAFVYKGKPINAQSVANELGAQYVVEGSVRRAVLREGAIAAALTALMILLFLGSWRSTVVVMISIPLAILTSLIVLYFPGETSTVYHREHSPPADRRRTTAAAGDTAWSRRIAVPTLVSMLAISCVFTSVVFLEGPAKYFFTPLGLAVVFANAGSAATPVSPR